MTKRTKHTIAIRAGLWKKVKDAVSESVAAQLPGLIERARVEQLPPN